MKERQFGARKETGRFRKLTKRDWLAKDWRRRQCYRLRRNLVRHLATSRIFVKRHGLRIPNSRLHYIKYWKQNREWPKADEHPHWNGGTQMVNGYLKVYGPGHPSADSRGYVLQHRYVMEQHLGRTLKPDEVVHHINGNKLDNRIENLERLANQEAHMQLHNTVRSMNQKIKKAKQRIEYLENLCKANGIPMTQ